MTFAKNTAFGGTEYMLDGVNSFMDLMPKLQKYNLIALPGAMNGDLTHLLDTKKIVWLHNTTGQLNANLPNAIFYSKTLRDTVEKWIVPSENLKNDLVFIGIEKEKIIVIPNAIEPLNNNYEKRNNVNKIKAVYTAGLGRGLSHLLNAWEYLDKDIELSVFGKWDKEPEFEGDFQIQQWEKFVSDPRISFYGFTHRNTLHRVLEESHLFLYPSSYRETFCINMAEAMSAGLSVVTSNTGALKEIGKDYIKTFDWDTSLDESINMSYINQINSFIKFSKSSYNKNLKQFAEVVNQAAQEVKEGIFDPTQQINYINETYNWGVVKQMWLDFHKSLPE
jgi:glycosyltransferase involved in cell wall biosynthesis